PHTPVAVQVAVLVCRQLVPPARKLDTTLNLLPSLNTYTLSLHAALPILVASLPCAAVTTGASVSSRMIVWLRLVALPHTSVAVQVPEFTCLNLSHLARKLDTTLKLLQSLNTGAVKLNAVPH